MKGKNDLIKCSFRRSSPTDELKKGYWIPWLPYCDDYGYHVIEVRDGGVSEIMRAFCIYPYVFDLGYGSAEAAPEKGEAKKCPHRKR